MQTTDGRLIVIGGASRSGKTAWVRKAIAKHARVCAWDTEDQFAQLRGWRRVTSRGDLLEALKKPGPLKLAYVAGGDLAAEFEFWSACVMYAGRYVAPLTAIAEELADVSTPAKAPGAWGILVRRGLKRGIWIYAISQRWSEADKTAFGNASDYVVFRQSSADDERYFSRKTGIQQSDIAALLPTLGVDGYSVKVAPFMTKNAMTGKVERGELRF